jgi:hypothetical protein
MKDEFIADLQKEKPEWVVSKWILERPTPYFFQKDHLAYIQWKNQLATKLGVDPHSIIVVGSANIGFSLNPDKNWKSFDDESDIDIAIISSDHFQQAWYFLRHIKPAERYRLSKEMQTVITSHETTYVYCGAIAAEMILGLLPFGEKWMAGIGEMNKESPLGHTIGLRIYKDIESLRDYTIHTFKKLRAKLQA